MGDLLKPGGKGGKRELPRASSKVANCLWFEEKKMNKKDRFS